MTVKACFFPAVKKTCVTKDFVWSMYYLQKHVDFMCSSMIYDLAGPFLYSKIQTDCTCGRLQSPLTSLDKIRMEEEWTNGVLEYVALKSSCFRSSLHEPAETQPDRQRTIQTSIQTIPFVSVFWPNFLLHFGPCESKE